MRAISTALVVGRGTAGAAAAIFMARGGIAVDLVESSPDVSALGSGIALHGNTVQIYGHRSTGPDRTAVELVAGLIRYRLDVPRSDAGLWSQVWVTTDTKRPPG